MEESALREIVLYLLSNVPGFPPITQSLHILGIASVMGSVLMIDLKILGVALPSQNTSEMISRLMPWTWWALLVNLITGSIFVIARPARYFYNPVFEIKFLLLLPAMILAVILYALNRKQNGFWEQSTPHLFWAKAISFISLLLWIGVVLAGRWIAYSEYLFYYE